MTTSSLTTSYDALWSSLVSALAGEGYSYNPLTTSEEQFLATAVTGITGSSVSYLNYSFSQLLALLDANLSAGPVSDLSVAVADMLALAIDDISSGVSSLPTLPDGFVFLLGADGTYLLGADGAYIYGVAP